MKEQRYSLIYFSLSKNSKTLGKEKMQMVVYISLEKGTQITQDLDFYKIYVLTKSRNNKT